MNITELARIIKITPQELRDSLPQLGFDIGQKAIKINRNVANKIIKEWPILRKRLEAQKETTTAEIAAEIKTETKKTIKLPNFITIKNFASVSGLPINVILSELMKNGVFASLNEKIDFETAWLVGSELGLDVKLEKDQDQADTKDENKLKKILEKENKKELLVRPPVVVVMGHVDHGKTRLLDAIRHANVIENEAGGITQHIGAYQVRRRKQLITFIDTPGHEAFTAMRGRGAKIADIAILVVAADDGVKPQTIEAYRIIKSAKIPFVIAINKIDKPEANIDKTKQELSGKLNITPEDWGGKTICAPISAKDGTGIDELLDMVLLTAEAESENIKANPKTLAVGTIIESHISRSSGPVATILIQNGTLFMGDQLVLDGAIIGKIKSLNDYSGKKIKNAKPAAPVQIIGLKFLPKVGDMIEVGDGKKIKRKKIVAPKKAVFAAPIKDEDENGEKIKQINLIIKSDALGSAEAIEESLAKINSKKVRTKIIRKGLGNITDGDIKRAEATGAQIIGFNVKLAPSMEKIAKEKNVSIKLYDIIYGLINDISAQIKDMAGSDIRRVDLGELKVLAVFKTEKNSQIIGGKVIRGKAEKNCLIEIKRNQNIIGKGELDKLQAGKQDVNEVEEGQECGIQYSGDPIISKDDFLIFYKNVEVKQDLK